MTPLERAHEADRFGGKASQLAAALALGLPVPGGFALEVEVVETVARGADLALPEGRYAVRSSAVGEDSEAVSFAGQHETLLHVPASRVAAAVRRVRDSASTEAALAYRGRMGIAGPPRMAVVVQRMVLARVAGVLFTRNPVTGAAERVVEASWGLGEAVVAGLVTPDSYRLSPSGELLEVRPGDKDVAVYPADEGTREVEVAPHLRHVRCLDEDALARLHELATRVERAFDGHHDIEWAFDDGALHLLQRRAITTVT